MRVFLAVQVLSLTTIQMMEDGLKKPGYKYSEEDLAPFKEIIFHLDQTTDIINARSTNKNVKKMGEVIDSPTHCHIVNLLKTLRLFTERENEVCKFLKRFISDESYKDLSCMILTCSFFGTT